MDVQPRVAHSRVPISSIGVVVPAHNEARLIGSCLESVQAAAAQVSVPVRVLVVLDACADETADVCEHFGVATRAIDAHCVGVARAVGMRELLHGQIRGRWLATTDADSVVAPDWLRLQLELADGGADAVVGLVDVADWGGTDPDKIESYDALYARGLMGTGQAHGHVHGANLGFRATVYSAVGGFEPIAVHEDQRLVAALDQDPHVRVVRSLASRVTTSARRDFRAPLGFGQFLLDLGTRDESRAAQTSPARAAQH